MGKNHTFNAMRPFSSTKIILRDYVGSFLKTRNYRKPDYIKFRLPFPLAMCVNVHTYCNESCVMCPHSDFYRLRPHGLMDFNFYKRMLSEFSSQGGIILTFNNFSEIFAHKEGIEYIKKALEFNGIEIYLVSNALNLSYDIANCLFDAGFEGIMYLSCHAFSEPTFKKATGRKGFETVKANITYVAKRHKHPERVVIQYIKDISSDKEVKEAIEYWEGIGVTINLMNSHAFCDKVEHGSIKFKQGKRLVGCNSWGHDAGLPFYQIVIQHNGDVSLCCMDVTGEIIIGNVINSSIKSIWNSTEYLNIIDLIYSGKTSSDVDFICNKCHAALYDSALNKPSLFEIMWAKIAHGASRLLEREK